MASPLAAFQPGGAAAADPNQAALDALAAAVHGYDPSDPNASPTFPGALQGVTDYEDREAHEAPTAGSQAAADLSDTRASNDAARVSIMTPANAAATEADAYGKAHGLYEANISPAGASDYTQTLSGELAKTAAAAAAAQKLEDMRSKAALDEVAAKEAGAATVAGITGQYGVQKAGLAGEASIGAAGRNNTQNAPIINTLQTGINNATNRPSDEALGIKNYSPNTETLINSMMQASKKPRAAIVQWLTANRPDLVK